MKQPTCCKSEQTSAATGLISTSQWITKSRFLPRAASKTYYWNLPSGEYSIPILSVYANIVTLRPSGRKNMTTWSQRIMRAYQKWQDMLPHLTDAYLQYIHADPPVFEPSSNLFSIPYVDVFGMLSITLNTLHYSGYSSSRLQFSPESIPYPRIPLHECYASTPWLSFSISD